MGGGISSEAVDAEAEPLRKLLESDRGEGSSSSSSSREEYWLKEELARLREREHKLSHEKHYWRTYARQLEQEKSELVKTHFFGAIRLESRLTSHKEEVYEPHSYSQDYKWYKTSCPCCRRPVEVTVTSLSRWQPRRARGRRAFVVVLWGANAGYALGALVLGLRLKELSPYIERVMLHTDDVPRNYLEALGEFWQLKEVDYIDGVEDLYVGKGNIFDGVFTKLGAWTLEEFEKVLLLDLDIIPLRAMDELFELPCPAAMVRGQGETEHGERVDGRRFFGGEDEKDYPWGQTGGINAGVILLQPDGDVFKQMHKEVTCKNHPCHIAGNGPEQDYLSRFFAASDTPWHQISVAWNYQLHQSLFAIERAVHWKRFVLSSDKEFSHADRTWLPLRMRIGLEEIGVVHFSGEVKLWHLLLKTAPSDDRRRNVSHEAASEWTDEGFAEYLLSIQRGHALWVARTAPEEEYQEHGCVVKNGRVFVADQDVTRDVDWMVEQVKQVATRATQVWRKCAESLLGVRPDVVEQLQRPQVPEGCLELGTGVEVSYTMPGRFPLTRMMRAQVQGVHANGKYVVRYERGGEWGDTERQVCPSRVRALEKLNGDPSKATAES
ncbi:unnamed protein product [Effrenium voratum]|uniref:Glycosyltransferase n=1 Tax=Effrenium voratum TaxID=2562239 RepID=A0AA36MIS4_9DINO|nr:unnamed protein product [Effrenium voratum]